MGSPPDIYSFYYTAAPELVRGFVEDPAWAQSEYSPGAQARYPGVGDASERCLRPEHRSLPEGSWTLPSFTNPKP